MRASPHSTVAAEMSSGAHPQTAVVLCGGRGTRLRPLTDDLPKALVPVQSRPILWHTIARLHEQGLRRFVLPTGYMGERIRAFAPTLRREFDAEIHCVETGIDTPIGARLRVRTVAQQLSRRRWRDGCLADAPRMPAGERAAPLRE